MPYISSEKQTAIELLINSIEYMLGPDTICFEEALEDVAKALKEYKELTK